ncbi:MAG: PAS domain S-box protein [Pseudomonadota bacterium]
MPFAEEDDGSGQARAAAGGRAAVPPSAGPTSAPRPVVALGGPALARTDAELGELFHHAPVGISMVSLDGRWLRVNPRTCQILGYAEAELLRMRVRDVTDPVDLPQDLDMARRLLAGEISHHIREKRYIRKDGSRIWINLTVTLMRNAAGRPVAYVSVIEDIQARKDAESQLEALRRDLEQRVQERTAELQAVLEHAQEVYVATNAAGEITEWNRQAERTFGWRRDEVMGRPLLATIVPPQQRAAYRAFLKRALRTVGTSVLETPLELQALRRDGSVFPVEVRASTLASGGGSMLCAFLHDISDRKALERLREEQALLDTLTGLPNRRALQEMLPRALARTRRSGRPLAVLFLDLDGLKRVNDDYGHPAGDDLLCQFARRLRTCVRETDAVSRLAGDEFVVVLEGLLDAEADARAVGAKIIDAASQPFVLASGRVEVGTSIGLCVHRPGDAADAEALIAAADHAMYAAKRAGRGRIVRAGSAEDTPGPSDFAPLG